MSPGNPIAEFSRAVEQARSLGIDTTPVALASVGADGRPSVRMVLLRGTDDRGLSFFTNYTSRKARELTANPHAALCFHWPTIEQQIRVEGTVARLSDAESDEYFRTRPRGSQIGAWASAQSQVLHARSELDAAVAGVEARFDGQAVTRPPFWGGFLLTPSRVEFWLGRADRLHDRLVYVREGEGWRTERLYP